MKLPLFEYACPTTLDEAVAILASNRETARVVAGGQSLIPIMAFRLAHPSILVDIRKLPSLDRIEVSAAGIRIGARVTWRSLEKDTRLKAEHPLLVAAVPHIAHYQIRNRGTVGGSLAHADPAAELPGIAVTCEAHLDVVGPNGSRSIQAADFFLGSLITALAPDEIITSLTLPPWISDRRWGFEEVARRRGDFAMAGVALYYDVDQRNVARNAHICAIGAGDRPKRLAETESILNGRSIDAASIAAAASMARMEVDPPSDIHASAAYRRALVAALVEKILLQTAGLTGD